MLNPQTVIIIWIIRHLISTISNVLSIVYSQSLRAGRLCSLESDFLKYCTKMKSWSLKRGYPENMVDKEMKKVKFSEKGSKNSEGSKGVPVVPVITPL